MSKAKAEQSAPTKSKSLILETPPDAPGRSRDYLMAKVAADGIVGNARTVAAFGEPTFGELSLTECAMVLKDTARELNSGDLAAAVTMLAAQAVALNAMFGELARAGQLNLFKAPDYAERMLRLAFKAQGQSRTTLETLAAIKNPPVLFARQANINNGGQQQVNNGTSPHPSPERAQAGAGAGKTENEPSKLLEQHDGKWLDTGAPGEASRADTAMEAVGTVDRAAKRRR